MNTKHLCVGILSLLATIQANAIDTTNETVIKQTNEFKSALNKVASLAVMDQKDPDGRERRHGAGGAMFGMLLGQALVWGPCIAATAVASCFGGPVGGVAVSTGIKVSTPFIVPIATKASLVFGTFFGVLTGPV